MKIPIRELISVNPNSILFKKIKVYYDSLRVNEVLLIGGVTFIGLIFNPNKFDFKLLPQWILIMLSSYTLLGHAFSANDWSGYGYDKNDVNKFSRPLIKGEISLSEIKVLSVVLLITSSILAMLVSYISLVIILLIAALNYLYSGEKTFLKSVPIVSTIIHGLGTSLGFLLGYTFTGVLNLEGIYFAIYFGIIYAAGHLNHEIMDNDSDIKSGISTNASLVGKKNSLVISYILFSFSYFYIILLVLMSILPSALISGAVVTFIIYTYFFIRTFLSKLDYYSMLWFRQKYRIIFLLWGIFMSLSIILNK